MRPDISALAQVRATVIPVQRRNSRSIRNRRAGRGRPECHPPHPHPRRRPPDPTPEGINRSPPRTGTRNGQTRSEHREWSVNGPDRPGIYAGVAPRSLRRRSSGNDENRTRAAVFPARLRVCARGAAASRSTAPSKATWSTNSPSYGQHPPPLTCTPHPRLDGGRVLRADRATP